jgi:hypothetical protein
MEFWQGIVLSEIGFKQNGVVCTVYKCSVTGLTSAELKFCKKYF